MCQSLNTDEAEELRADMYKTLRHSHPPEPNLSKEEWKALKQLNTDKECIVLTGDKGVVLVVMDRQEYMKKAKILLESTNTYRPIPRDPTNKHKNRLINILKNMKVEYGMSQNTYKMMYPTGANAPKFYGMPKIHKKDVPLRPIVSSIGSVTYGAAKELVRILKTLVCESIYHGNNSKKFTDEIRNTKIEEGECITSFDVTALFTSLPVISALEVIKDRLEKDTELPNTTILSVSNIMELLGFCLNNTYFLFQNQFWANWRSCHWIICKSNCGQYLHGGL